MSDWIEWKWTPEKQFPTYKGKVYIRHNDGWESTNALRVISWCWEPDEFGIRITHYRLASEEN